MATKHTLTGLFAHILAPVTDAIHAETGRRISTAGWGRIVRTVAAHGLRLLAGLVEPDAAQVQAPEPVAEVVAVAPESAGVKGLTPEPVAPVAVPFGWGSLDLPTVETAPEPAPVVPVEVKPAKGKATPKERKGKAPAPAKVWTVAEVAARLDTQPRAVRKWIAAGRLKATQTGKVWTVADADLTAFLATLDKSAKRKASKAV